MRCKRRLKVGMLSQHAAQQSGTQLYVVATKIFFFMHALLDLRHIRARQSPLIDALHHQFARTVARALGGCFDLCCLFAHASAFFKFAISIATSAASAPLTVMRSSACSSVSVVRMALAMGMPYCNCTSPTPCADSLETISKW